MTTSQAQERAVEDGTRFMAIAEKLPHLLSLSAETVEILYLLDGGDGDESELVARLEELEAALAVKLDRCAWTVRDLERLAEARKSEADKLRDNAKRLEAAADRLKGLMLTAMQATGQQRIDTPRYTVRRQFNNPRCDVLEEALVPARFKEIRTEVYIDRRAILNAVTKDGEVVPGVSVTRAESVRIG